MPKLIGQWELLSEATASIHSEMKRLGGEDSACTYYAVADIHACSAPLRTMLQLLRNLSKNVIFLGDYLDRGDSSFDTVEMLVQAKAENPDWVFLVGNHEALFLDGLKSGKPGALFPNMADDEYRQRGLPPAHLSFLQALALYVESERFIFVHGGVSKDVDKPMAEHSAEELIWCYEVSPHWKGKRLVRGHKIVTDPVDAENHVSLDTGCFKKNSLTTGILDDASGRLLGWLQVSFSGQTISLFQR